MTATPDPPARIAVLGCGNPSRGDDALGPALMERVEEWAAARPGREIVTVQDYQLQVEHTLDIAGCGLVLFVDAGGGGADPFTLRPVRPSDHGSFTTHALSPEALLRSFRTLGFGDPPKAFSLGIRGHAFELGQPLSARARENLERAWDLVRELLENPSRIDGHEKCGEGGATTPQPM